MENLLTFEVGPQKLINVLIWVFVGIQQKDRQNSELDFIDTFYRLLVTNTQCKNGTTISPDASAFLWVY